MSQQSRRKQNGMKLPFELQKELGIQNDESHVEKQKRYSGSQVANRKENRKALRAEKHRPNGRPQLKSYGRNAYPKANHSSQDGKPQARSTAASKASRQMPVAVRRENLLVPEPKVNTNQTIQSLQSSSPIRSSASGSSRASSPGLLLDPHSTSFRTHAEDDDAEIAALERKLGLKGKKKAKLGDEVLDYVLDGLDGKDESRKRKREGQSWLDKKRRKTEKAQIQTMAVEHQSSESEESEDTGDQSGSDVMGDLSLSEGDFDGSDAQSSNGDDFNGFEPGRDLIDAPVHSERVRENPYVAPSVLGSTQSKYVPPSLRKWSEGDNTNLESLRRQLQGQLNKLSEANMISILGEIEKSYRTNPRQDVTTVLIDLILASFCIRSALQNTFIVLHAAFLAAVYKVMGTDFGAELLVRLVERFDREYGRKDAGKEALNLVSLLANLFTFNVVSSNMIYDHVRLLLLDFNEANAELLLRVVRDCGPQLRSDDPSALRSIVQTMQDTSSDMSKKGQKINTRMQVMMDTIIDLKNHKAKNAINGAAQIGEHITRMRKALGSLSSRTLKATEPLRFTRDDIANSDKKGKWWLVGASWKGNEILEMQTSREQCAGQFMNGEDVIQHEDDVDLLALAKQYRMNTDVRRAIFVAIMSASDCRDAQTRLLKLRLSTKQTQEIGKVLLRCARAEPAYNAYYSLLAKNLCKDNKKIRMGFQFGLWDFFKRMGEQPDEESDDDGGDSAVEVHEIVNLAKMYAYLIFHHHLDIGVLKTLNIGFLKEQATMFLETLLIGVMTQPRADEEEVIKVFSRAIDTPQMVKSLRFFIKNTVRKSDLVSQRDRERVRAGCRAAQSALNTIDSVATG